MKSNHLARAAVAVTLLSILLVGAVGIGGSGIALADPSSGADDTRFTTIKLRGRLADPETASPMVGAVVRFVSIEAGGGRAEAVTNENGEFVVEGLPYSIYAMEIETADGERIYGVNSLPLTRDKPVEVEMKISDRMRSTTTLENKPTRFFAAVQLEQSKWHRFWVELGIFLGATAGVAAAAL